MRSPSRPDFDASRQSLPDVLRYNPFRDAERVTGQRTVADARTQAIGAAFAREHRDQKRLLLSQLGDTHSDLPVAEVERMLSWLGFTQHVRLPLPLTGGQYGLWFDQARGLLLAMQTGGVEAVVEDVTVFGNWVPTRPEIAGQILARANCTWHQGASSTIGVTVPAREALRYRLGILDAAGSFLPEWEVKPLGLGGQTDLLSDLGISWLDRLSLMPPDVLGQVERVLQTLP